MYKSIVFRPRGDSFQLFDNDCLEVQGHDNSKKSMRTKLRLYVIDFGNKCKLPNLRI